MIGGPIKKPMYPNNETDETAVPMGTTAFLEASRKIMGTKQDTPNPINKNPMTIRIGYGKITATRKPIPSRMALALTLSVSLAIGAGRVLADDECKDPIARWQPIWTNQRS